MSVLILNRESFSLPGDGWYQVAPLGVFPHAGSGLVQVVDAEACGEMVRAFGEEASGKNFAGLLIDFDHFSLDAGNRSEAAGWITALEARVPQGDLTEAQRHGEGGISGGSGYGLWAKIRWSDLGEEAVTGGRYRFLSPVWGRGDCVDLGDGRVRPVRLLNAAVTNDPNLKGLVPLSNSRGAAVGIRDKEEGIRDERRTLNIERPTSNAEGERLANADGGRRLKWVLGDSPEDRHCPSCSALAGMVQTEAAWEAAGLRPKSGRLFCREHCHCRLVETDEAVWGDLGSVRALYERPALGNAGGRSAEFGVRSAESLVREAKWALRNNWTEEARDASLAVRRAKAKKRGKDLEDEGVEDAGLSGDEKKRAKEREKARERALARVREKVRLRRG